MNIMKTQITEQGSIEQFLIRYKKWFIAALGLHMIPGLIFFSTVIGIIVYGYVGSDIRWHSYRPHIEAGYGAGLRDGIKQIGVVYQAGRTILTLPHGNNIKWKPLVSENELQKKGMSI